MAQRKIDAQSGRRMSLAMESLGEALVGCDSVPEAQWALHAEALSQGRSTVPAPGHSTDFARRVREPLPTGLAALSGWLGSPLAEWLERDSPGGLRELAEVALEARAMVLELHAKRAEAHRGWYSIGLPEAPRELFARASEIALGEAIDRWCALGCEADLGRYVTTWQRSAAGWVESALGTAVEIPLGDLGRLRELQGALRDLRREGLRPEAMARALEARLGWTQPEIERLVAMESVVRERIDPRVALRRRWTLVQPIAQAVAALEKALGRMPTIEEIAERAGVHEARVELCLEAIDE